jgi:serine/threonine-protein kinase
MQFQPGHRVGDYEVLQVLGAGGMGKVYKVRNLISDRIEAMKVLLPDLHGHPDLADRFLREIKVQASLSHPNIAALYTALRHENQLLMFMEFMEGTSVEALMEQGPIPLDRAIDIVSQVLAALAYAHARGVIHRDIKPANIMLTPAGEVKLMDFGIARMKADKRLTQTGRTVGSLFYMSPEQIRGDQQLDARTDIYSLGIALYEIVTGRRPFVGDSDFSIMAAHLNQPPVPPIQIDPSLPSHLNEVVLMAINKEPAQRFQSADAFRNALGNAGKLIGSPATQPMAEASPAPPPQATSPSSRRGLYMALGSLATLAVIVVAAIEGPKLFQTQAGSQAVVPQAAPPAVSEPVTQPDPNSNQVITTTAPPGSTHAAQPQATPSGQNPVPASPVLPKQVALPSSVPAAGLQSPASNAAASESQNPPPAAQQPQSQPAVQLSPSSQPAAPAPAQELEALRDRMMKLAARVGAVQAKARRIEAEQRAQGLGMRSDVVSGISRMTFYMDEAEHALRSSNAAAARTALQRADMQVETLERILGI